MAAGLENQNLPVSNKQRKPKINQRFPKVLKLWVDGGFNGPEFAAWCRRSIPSWWWRSSNGSPE